MSHRADVTDHSGVEQDLLSALIASANPIALDRTPHLASSAIVSAIGDAGLEENQGSLRRRWPKPARLGALVFALVVIVTTGAATFYVGVHTGLFGPPNATEEDTSEWLNVNSPEILQVIDQDAKKYPLPPGGSWSAFRAEWPTKQPMRLQATGVESATAWEAACQWRGYWLAGYQSKNGSQMSSAQAGLDQMLTWPIMRNPKAYSDSAQTNLRTVVHLASVKNGTEFERLYDLQCGVANR